MTNQPKNRIECARIVLQNRKKAMRFARGPFGTLSRMKPRAIPKELYSEVFEVMTSIKDAALADDEAAQEAGCLQLRAIYDRELAAGRVDPFLTEALADSVGDPNEAVALYRLSLQQAASISGEPVHSKRLGLARQLRDLGEIPTAQAELDAARFDANKFRDSEALAEIAELSRELRR